MNSRLDLLQRKAAAWLLLPGAWISPRHMRFWVIALILTYTLSGFLLLPWIGKSQIIARVSESLQRPVQLDELRNAQAPH